MLATRERNDLVLHRGAGYWRVPHYRGANSRGGKKEFFCLSETRGRISRFFASSGQSAIASSQSFRGPKEFLDNAVPHDPRAMAVDCSNRLRRRGIVGQRYRYRKARSFK